MRFGYGLEGTLTDGKIGRIEDRYIVPYLKNNNWEDGIKNGYNALLEEVCHEYNITISGVNKAVSTTSESFFKVSPSMIIATLIMLYIVVRLIMPRRGYYYRNNYYRRI